MKKIYLISNDKIWFSNNRYTSNNDLNNIITCLNKNYDLNLLCRKSSTKLNFKLDDNFKLVNINQIIEKRINFFMVSITPYNFLIYLYLILLKRKKLNGFVFLRSDGFLEYKYRLGLVGYFIYYLMFKLITKKLKILSCSKNFTNVSVKEILHPSELDAKWFENIDLKKFYETDFLYIGRFKKEKGVFYLVKIFNDYLKNYNCTVVGTKKSSIPKKYHLKNIFYKDSISNLSDLIREYDKAQIFILPSYLEGFPKVISEALARLKPVIIFSEISYVINSREGIFVCERNEESLKKTINHIHKNYEDIQKKIQQSHFYTKENFGKELLNSTKNEFCN